MFSAQQIALQICITKPKKGRQTSPNWKNLGIIMVCVVWQGGAGIRDSEHEENASVALVISSGLRLFKTHKKRDGFNLIPRSSHKNSC